MYKEWNSTLVGLRNQQIRADPPRKGVRCEIARDGKEVYVYAVRFLLLEADMQREKAGCLYTTGEKTGFCLVAGMSVLSDQ